MVGLFMFCLFMWLELAYMSHKILCLTNLPDLVVYGSVTVLSAVAVIFGLLYVGVADTF